MSDVATFRLVEKTAGPWHGKVWRCEQMTQEQADAVNARISVMKWEREVHEAAGGADNTKHRRA